MLFFKWIKAVIWHWWIGMSCAVWTVCTIVMTWWDVKPKTTVYISLWLTFILFIVATYLAWASEYRKNEVLSAGADIKGHIHSAWINGSRLIIKASIVNHSPAKSPTIRHFFCELPYRPDAISVKNEHDISTEFEVTHRDESGRATGSYPGLDYFNDTPLVDGQHRDGYLRFEIPNDANPGVYGEYSLFAVDGWGREHLIGKNHWPIGDGGKM